MEVVISLKRTDSNSKDFINLVRELDVYLSQINGEEDDFFKQFNSIESLKNVLVCYVDEKAVGCGAFKEITEKTVEIKRMYVNPNYRGNNIATLILNELESWAKEKRFTEVVLETSKTMLPAVNLYQKNKYSVMPNYGPYKNIVSSICFKKYL